MQSVPDPRFVREATSASSGRCAIRGRRIATRTPASANDPRQPWTGLFPHEIPREIKGTNESPQRRGGALARQPVQRCLSSGGWPIDLDRCLSASAARDTHRLPRGQSSPRPTRSVIPFGPASRELEDTVARQDDVLGSADQASRREGRARALRARPVRRSRRLPTFPSPVVPGRVAQEDVRERIEEILDDAVRPGTEQHAVRGGREQISSALPTECSTASGPTPA